MNIWDLLEANVIATYYTEVTSNKIPYLGQGLFPSTRMAGLELKWIKGAGGLPVQIATGAFDTKAKVRDRIGVGSVSTEMPFFRESMRIGEEERQKLLQAQASANSQYIMPLINKIYDDAKNLVDGTDVAAERMRMELLASGKINIMDKDGVGYQYDYRHNSTNKTKLTGIKKWSDPENSDPIKDLNTWADKVNSKTGNRPTRAICTQKTWDYIMENRKIKLSINPVGASNIILTTVDMKAYIKKMCGLDIYVYNKMYAIALGGENKLFYPDNQITLMPPGNLGNTYYGTTPEEADLLSGNSSRAKVSIVNTGVAITTFKEEHPVNAVTIVSGIILPSFESIDSVFIAEVA